ncbi:diheme cytochrome SoxA (sulfur oxidation) [Rhizobiales bacterium GAS113]|nr:diheme cytochrome SoxA (sulfur oxidation) [Rhizobiales bacterium GAS113]
MPRSRWLVVAVLCLLAALCLGGFQAAGAAGLSDPDADLKAFRAYYVERFPSVPLNDFVNGPYSMNADMRKQWQEKEEFPPYDFALDAGKELFETPFKNGKTYADCFPDKGIGVRQNYPVFDEKAGEVVTLELAINRCREANGEAAYSYTKDEMADVTAYMAFTSRGKPFAITIPNDPRAREAYDKGKQYFYTRRGQLNFSCASCHVQNPGERMRGEMLAPGLGILAAMPIYRSEWGGMGTISRRFVTCNSQVRSTPLEPQDELYRDVEYYLSFMSNGLPISGPGSRP